MNWLKLILVWTLPWCVACSNFEKQPQLKTSSNSSKLDVSFAGTGYLSYAFNGLIDHLMVLPDDSMLLSGNENNLGVIRYAIFHITKQGALDSNFGVDGKVVTDLRSGIGFALQSDRKIIVGGTNASGSPVVIRLDPQGAKDPSFGTSGESAIDAIYSPDIFDLKAIAVQSDNKILVAGSNIIGPASPVFSLTRLEVDGSADNLFGVTNGTADTGVIQNLSHLYLDRNQDIVLGGSSCLNATFNPVCEFILARYTSVGVLDSGFASSGILHTGATAAGTLAEQSTGNILVGATLGGFNAILRYTGAGALDTSFGENAQANSPGNIFAVDLNDDLYAAATSSLNTMTLTRFLLNGQLDSKYVSVGLLAPISSLSSARAIALDSDGNILIAGMTKDFNGSTALGWLIERFIP